MQNTDKGMHEYDDIIDLPHHQSERHPHMTMLNRAAQFSTFAALVGYDAQIRETARRTEPRQELDEAYQAELDEKLCWIREHLSDRPEVTIVYFQPDNRKNGGAYLCAVGRVRKIDPFLRTVVFENGQVIAMDDIYEIRRHMH